MASGRYGTILDSKSIDTQDGRDDIYLVTLEVTTSGNTVNAAVVLYCTWTSVPFYQHENTKSITIHTAQPETVTNQEPDAKSDWSSIAYSIGGTTYNRSVILLQKSENITGGTSGGVNVSGYYKCSTTGTYMPVKGTYNLSGSTSITTYTISYNANGGSGAPGSQTKIYDVALTLSNTQPTRTGYTFVNWKASNGTTYSPGSSYTANSDTTLTAQWSPKTYTITYDANGGSEAPSDTTYTYADSGTVTLSSTVPTRSGYAFKGWSTSSSATTATYSAGGAFPKNTASDTILYAVWWPYLDVNGTLDGTAMGGVSGLGTFDITIGSSTLTNQEDYYQALQPDTSYSISNITQEYGYTYTGNTGSLSGTISNSTVIVLNYVTKKPWDVNIRTNERTTSSIALSWGAEGLNITKYVLHYRADSVSSFTNRDMGTSTTVTLSLLEDTNYEIYVTATNSAGSTDSSHYNDSTLLTNPRIDNFVTTNITPFTVSTLTTVSQSRTRDLEYQFSTDGGTTWSAAQANNSYTFTGLNEETTYTLGVKVTRKHIGVSSSDTYATTTLQVTTPADQAQIWRHNGSVWQKGKAFVFDNNTWKKAKKIYRYDGSNWAVNKNN